MRHAVIGNGDWSLYRPKRRVVASVVLKHVAKRLNSLGVHLVELANEGKGGLKVALERQQLFLVLEAHQ